MVAGVEGKSIYLGKVFGSVVVGNVPTHIQKHNPARRRTTTGNEALR